MTVRCTTSVVEEVAQYSESRILAAGYAECDTAIYNTLSQFCTENTVYEKADYCNGDVSEKLSENDFCYNGMAFSGNDYASCNDNIYEKAMQFCTAYNTVETLCGGKAFDPSMEFRKNGTVANIYAMCKTAIYDVRKLFCDSDSGLTELCQGKSYSRTTEYCSAAGEVTNKPLCGTVLYNPNNQFCDDRDDQLYKFTKIGEQTWMAQSLNYEPGSRQCAVGVDNDGSCEEYGRLYEGDEAQEACPSGWHLPSLDEMYALVNFVGDTAAKN